MENIGAVALSSPRTRVRVLLVDDHPVFREGLAAVLEREPDFEVVGQVGAYSEALDVARQLKPDLVVVDVVYRVGSTDGIALAHALHSELGARILGLSVIDEPSRIAEMLHAGATGFACKTQPVTELVDALRAVADGVRYIAPALRPDVELLARAATLPHETLTPRERDVLALLLRGLTNDKIAAQMFISPRTVDTHRQRVMGKLGVHSIVDLLRLAARRGELV